MTIKRLPGVTEDPVGSRSHDSRGKEEKVVRKKGKVKRKDPPTPGEKETSVGGSGKKSKNEKGPSRHRGDL